MHITKLALFAALVLANAMSTPASAGTATDAPEYASYCKR